MGYINNPKTKEELENNVQFQLENVMGWISAKDYESALIKANSLVDALEKRVNKEIEEPKEKLGYKRISISLKNKK